MAVLDILFSKPNAALQFTVNNLVNEVAIADRASAPGAYIEFQTGNGGDKWTSQDNVIIQSVFIKLPYCFHLSTGIPVVALVWMNSAQTIVDPIQEVGGGSGETYLPFDGREVEFDVRGAAPVTGISQPYLGLGTTENLNVSMIGVPDSLNGLTFDLQVGVKVLHTLPISS